MKVALKLAAQPLTSSVETNRAAPTVQRWSQTVDTLRQILGDGAALDRGAVKNDAFVRATYRPGKPDNYLFALDARDSVITTLYDPSSKKGVVLHLDGGLEVADEIRKALRFINRAPRNASTIEAHMVGGVWIGAGNPVGEEIRLSLRSHLIEPKWEDWSYTTCYEHRYGVKLDLARGDLTVFEHTPEVGGDFRQAKWDAVQARGAGSAATPCPLARPTPAPARNDSVPANPASLRSPASAASAPAKHTRLEQMVNNVKYVLSGETKAVRAFSEPFAQAVASASDSLSQRPFAEIKSFLEDAKNALGSEAKVELEVIRPARRSATSAASSLEDSNQTSSRSVVRRMRVLTPHAGEQQGADLKLHFCATYTAQLELLSDHQKEIVSKVAEDIVDRIRTNRRMAAHPAVVAGFSVSDQRKIEAEFGSGTTNLYSETLSNWEGNAKGRGRWRLLFKRQHDDVKLFGVFDTHTRPFMRYG